MQKSEGQGTLKNLREIKLRSATNLLARHPTLGPAGRKIICPVAGVTYPAQEERIPRRTSRGRIMYVS
jgi:hypothetical protein